jgi:molybdate transport system substrate-binding protein
MRFLLVIPALCLMLLTLPFSSGFAADLRVFAGAGLMKPMEEMCRNFEEMNNVDIEVHYGSSGEIFGMLSMGQTCDVFIPGAAKYTMDGVKNGWIDQSSMIKVVKHVPVILVPAENPAGIERLEDLVRPGVKVAIGDPKAPAIGKVAKKILEKSNLWEPVQKNLVVLAPTCNQLLIYAALGQADATINWEDVSTWAEDKGKIRIIRIAPEQNLIKDIPTALHVSAVDKPLAVRLNQYIGSEEGMRIWEAHGFERWR